MGTLYWDYCVRAQDAKEVEKIASALGWSGVCMLTEGPAKDKANDAKGKVGAVYGTLAVPKKAGDVAKAVREGKARGGIVAITGTSDEVNRVAVETPGVAMLLPGGSTKVDVIMARIAKENGVMIVFEFSPLLHASPGERGKVFSQMVLNARSVRKHDAPFAIASGATSPYGMRSPSELMSFGRLLGFSDPKIRESMGPSFALSEKKKASGRFVMPGVEVEE